MSLFGSRSLRLALLFVLVPGLHAALQPAYGTTGTNLDGRLLLCVCDPGTTPDESTDADADGYDSSEDCDDNDAAIHPAASEDCDGVDNDCDGVADEGFDEDGDGHTTCAGDCDDHDAALELDDVDGDGVTTCDGDCDDEDPSSYPLADEICDQVDNDCDATIDEQDAIGCTNWFLDDDGDDFGLAADGLCLCEPTEPHTASATGDCDDSDPSVFPGAAEVCDTIDNDCDGFEDEGFDADADGYTSCAGDCDDTHEDVHPGAAEICDGLDNDCDGSAGPTEIDADGDGAFVCSGDCDEANPATYPGATEICDGADNDCDGSTPANETDADGDSYMACQGDCADLDPNSYPGAAEDCDGMDNDCDGLPAANEADQDGDGFMICDGDCDDGDDTTYPTAQEICGDLADNDCDGTDNGCAPVGDLDLADADIERLGIGEDDWASRSVVFPGDVNDDGHLDLAVTASAYPDRVYVLFGPLSAGTASLSTSEVEYTGAGYDQLGCSVARAGDVNDDGVDDLLMGAYQARNPGGVEVGGAYLVYGPLSAGSVAVAAADVQLFGEADGDLAGNAVAGTGDVNGDGFADVLVGAPWNDGGGSDAGAAYLELGPISPGFHNLVDVHLEMTGELAGDEAGAAVATAGDLDDDGFSDFMVGAPYESSVGSNSGAVYVFYGPPPAGDISLGVAPVKFVGSEAEAQAGQAVASAGDLNGDGYDDILIGAPMCGPNGNGAVSVVHGPLSAGLHDLAAADVRFLGQETWGYTGLAVAGGGDVNGDGHPDIAIGSPDFHLYATGTATLLYGPFVNGEHDLSDQGLWFLGEQVGDRAGGTLAMGGDIDEDGYDDVVIGALYHDGAATDSGVAYIYLGTGI